MKKLTTTCVVLMLVSAVAHVEQTITVYDASFGTRGDNREALNRMREVLVENNGWITVWATGLIMRRNR